jgi:hypothetical protein
VALPWLEAMTPRPVMAAGAARHPLRMAVLYMPMGTKMIDWTPPETGALPENLPLNLRSMAALRKDFSVITGLRTPSGLDGAALHSHAMSTFLTGAAMRPTEGPDIRNGASADQIAAKGVGGQTYLPSLQMGTFAVNRTIEPGFNPAYLNLSWRDSVTPVRPATSPREVFDRLFTRSAGAESRSTRARHRSILDYVREEANSLEADLGAQDRRRLDQYLTSIREVEQQIQRVERMPAPTAPKMNVPDGDWSRWVDRWQEQVRVQADLMVLAFQADLTRVCTFALEIERSVRVFRELGIRDDYHGVSHGNEDDLSRIAAYQVAQFAYVVEKMKQVREGDGTLLDHSMMVFGSAMSNGGHNTTNLPILLAGRGCGTLKPGRHFRFSRETPLSNLWVSLLDRMDVRVDKLGDSRGRLSDL